MYISKTTAEERLHISLAVDDIFNCIERAHRILMGAWDDYFNKATLEGISSEDAERISDTIYIATDILHDAITEYHLTVGSEDYDGVDAYIEGADRARSNIWIEKNRYKLPNNGRDVMGLPDDRLTEIIKALLAQQEGGDQV